jgi:hypothetical protein
MGGQQPKQVNVVWVDRVIVRENGIAVDVPHAFNPETGTCAVRNDASVADAFDAGYAVGYTQAQQLPQETVDRMMMQLPILDVNDGEQLDEDGGLFG